jgi:hypothetical protein
MIINDLRPEESSIFLPPKKMDFELWESSSIDNPSKRNLMIKEDSNLIVASVEPLHIYN